MRSTDRPPPWRSFPVPKLAHALAEAYGVSSPAQPVAHKREYCTYLADIPGAVLLVTSTGIGGPSTSIAIEELAHLGVDTFIRVGTTGAIQNYIAIGDVVITTASVRLDGASFQYAPIEYPAVAHHDVLTVLIQAAASLASSLQMSFHVGITASTDTFYQGQKRHRSFSNYVPRHYAGMTEEWQKLHVLNYEMESSTLLTMCAAFGLRGGCITGVVNNRSTDEDISAEHLRLSEDHAIETAIQAIKLLTHATP